MPPVGYQDGGGDGGEKAWWWKIALHLDAAQLALTNAMVHNLDDPRPVQALQESLREGQAILLEIFRVKGLLPASNGKTQAPTPPTPPTPPLPPTPLTPLTPPMVVVPQHPQHPQHPEQQPETANGEAVAVAEPAEPAEIVAEEPAVSEANQVGAETDTAASSAPLPEVVASAPADVPSVDPDAGGAGA